MLLQFVVASREVAPVARFNTAASSLYSCVSITAIASLNLYEVNGLNYGYRDGLFVTAILEGIQIAASLALFATVWLIRRRPEVFRPNGKVVDSLFTGTLWERYSFSWSLGMLNAAGTEKFENSDMPSMDHVTRSENSTADFKRIIFRQISFLCGRTLLGSIDGHSFTSGP